MNKINTNANIMHNPWDGNYHLHLNIFFSPHHISTCLFEHDPLPNWFLTYRNHTIGLCRKLVNSYDAVVLRSIGKMENIDKRVRLYFYILLLITSIVLILPCDDDSAICLKHGRHLGGKRPITFLGRWSTLCDLCMPLAMKSVHFYHINLRHSDIPYT